MSDTPRTDTDYVAHYAHHDENRNLCCKLERELAAAQKLKCEWESLAGERTQEAFKMREKLNAEIKRADEAERDAKLRAKVITECQEQLARYIVPDSGITDFMVVNRLLGILDGSQTREAMRMDKTPGQVAYDTHAADIDRLSTAFKAVVAAVTSHVVPKIRAAAFEDAKKACTIPDGEGTYTYWPCIKAIVALATLPSSHVCVPVDFLSKLSTYHPDGICKFGVHGIAGFFHTATEALEAYNATAKEAK